MAKKKDVKKLARKLKRKFEIKKAGKKKLSELNSSESKSSKTIHQSNPVENRIPLKSEHNIQLKHFDNTSLPAHSENSFQSRFSKTMKKFQSTFSKKKTQQIQKENELDINNSAKIDKSLEEKQVDSEDNIIESKIIESKIDASKIDGTKEAKKDIKEKQEAEQLKEAGKTEELKEIKETKGVKESKKIKELKTLKEKTKQQTAEPKKEAKKTDDVVIDTYDYISKNIPVKVTVVKRKGEFVPIYDVSIASISKTTEFMLERIRQELIRAVNLEIVDLTDMKKTKLIETQFEETIKDLIAKYFPDADDGTKGFLTGYLLTKSLGLGMIEFVMNDEQLEEIVVNEATEPIWCYHRKHGWLKTNIFLRDEDQTKHYASIIARKVGRQISVLEPLLDAHMEEGDRVNATISPISTAGNTLTFRKFSRDPWTITKFIESKAISPEAAAIIWIAIQFEMSAIIAGGTASGKTSALNCFANFFPPNQRIISIEDTREIRLPKFLHWVPMNTRIKNAEGKGEISMEDLLVNSLRMRPDRILVGEVRRKLEAETLFEAIHTGHSVYATFHANNAEQTIERLTNQPIDVPKIMLPAISLIIVQFRNRRTGSRRTFQIAEILDDASANILMQYDQKKDMLVKKNQSKSLFKSLELYTGMSNKEIQADLKQKEKILIYLVKNQIKDVDSVGRIIAEYYTNQERLMKFVNSNKRFEE